MTFGDVVVKDIGRSKESEGVGGYVTASGRLGRRRRRWRPVGDEVVLFHCQHLLGRFSEMGRWE